MKINIYIFIGLLSLLALSCAKWTEPQPLRQKYQDGITRRIPLLEAKTEEDLPPSERERYRKIRKEYRTSPHVRGFGYFGNWSGKGSNAMRYLRNLPDSVDFVSLWGVRDGAIDEAMKEDLRFFQEVKGGKALLCWIIQNLGDQLTPGGKKAEEYWIQEKGGGDMEKAVKAYADSIANIIDKYNLDGFDIDYEPHYGHSGTLANVETISMAGNKNMQIFIETLSARFRPKGKLLVMDGQPGLLSTETSKLVDYYIYQAYWDETDNAVTRKVQQNHLDKWEEKTILVVEFEKGWKTGGVPNYTSTKHPEFNGKDGAQIFSYATFDLPNGKRIGGVGTYHMEYDINGGDYRWLRQALRYGNKIYPGKF